MNDLIIKGDTRILRPWEFRKLVDAIPKNYHKDQLETLLYTGMRYHELQRLYNNPQWLVSNSIKMHSGKPKSVYPERFIRLNPQGLRSVTYFLRGKKLPNYSTWDENLKRWAKYADLDPTGISIKTTRKTWESWLVTSYPNQIEYIFLSQGHDSTTALKFYLMIPFYPQDKQDMKFYTDGWI